MKKKANGRSELAMHSLQHGEREGQVKKLRMGTEIKSLDASALNDDSPSITTVKTHLLSSNSGAPQQTDQPAEPVQLTPQAVVAIANMHVVDQGIHDIAKEFRFTVEEVQEYYDRCGEMGRTKSRFQKMRHELQSRFIDDDK
jgi:hypothetical protein